MKKQVLLLALVVVSLMLVTTVSASVDSIDYPYNNQILTSPTIDLEISTTGSTSCYWNYNNVHNESIACSGGKIRLPTVEGNYSIYVSDDTGDSKNISVSLVYPNGFVIIFFNFVFIFICFEMLGLLLWTLLHFIEINIDAKDLILNISSYFGVWAFYILGLEYLGNPFISDFTLFLIEVGAITTVLIPIIGFVVSYVKQNTTKGDRN